MAGGASAYHTVSHFNETIAEKKFNARVKNVTGQIGVISIQGPKSQKIVEELTGLSLDSKTFPPYASMTINFKDPTNKGLYV